jgi:hypothetical protein
MKLRFTIRDLLWLTLAVAIIAGIWRDIVLPYQKWAAGEAAMYQPKQIGLTMALYLSKNGKRAE